MDELGRNLICQRVTANSKHAAPDTRTRLLPAEVKDTVSTQDPIPDAQGSRLSASSPNQELPSDSQHDERPAQPGQVDKKLSASTSRRVIPHDPITMPAVNALCDMPRKSGFLTMSAMIPIHALAGPPCSWEWISSSRDVSLSQGPVQSDPTWGER